MQPIKLFLAFIYNYDNIKVSKVERGCFVLNKVARYRKYLGLTQKDLARIFGISSQAYSRKERGKTAFNDKEKVILKNLFIEFFPNITIDDIFFSQEVSKVES